MLRKFKINIDGTDYKVEMEEIGAPAPAPAPTPAAAPAPQPTTPVEQAAAVAPSDSVVTPAGTDAQLAPMPGKILDIKMNVGAPVAKNDVVLILEAMKMENEIVAEKAGTLQAVHVAKGDMVNPGDALFTIA